MKYLILFIVLQSCIETFYKDERLTSTAEKVTNELSTRGLDVSFSYSLFLKKGLADGGAYGLSKGNSIYIDEDIFFELIESNPERIEALFLHELGHNIFGFSHSENKYSTDESGRPIAMHLHSWQNVNKETISFMYDEFLDKVNK